MGYGDRICFYRKQNNMTQSELGKQLGVTSQAVSKWELDKAEPDRKSIVKMCELFGIDANDLLDIHPAVSSDNEFNETLYRRPEMRILFAAAKDAPDDVLQKTADLLEAMKNGKQGY